MKFLLPFVFLFSSSVFALQLRQHAMGDACYLLRQKTSTGLCHPANVARDDEQFFYGNFLFSEGMHQTENWKNVVDGNAKPQQVISLLEDDRVSYLTSETNMGLIGNSWAITFKPYELWAKTRIQNPSNPYAQISAGFAQVLALDFGHYINDSLSVGVKVEGAQMKTLERSFFLTDLLIDGQVDLKPKKETNIVLSPGIAFEPEEAWGSARYSVLAKQSYVDNEFSFYSGVSFQNTGILGAVEWGAGAKFQKSEVKPQAFTHYTLGITTITASLSAEEQTFGAFLKLKSFDSGLSYYVTDSDRALLFQMGFSM